jgi:hypothetical protein
MTKWQEQLKQQALNGDQAADDILWETRDMSDDELARYVADNDERIRNAMHMKYLAEKDAKPELVKEYYDMFNKGQQAYAGPGRVDAGGYGKARSVDDWMGIFGVQPKHVDPDGKGSYSNDERAAFTNPESPTYYAKLKKPEQLKEIASWQGFDNADLMDEDIRRASDMFQRERAVEGYNPDNSVDLVNWGISALKGFAAPRVKEAQLEGREPTWQDITGDMVEAGLNFIPGYGIVSKSGQLVARIPSKWVRQGIKGAAGAVESMAVPGLSQVYDMNVYDEGPRADFDLKRFGAQAAGFGSGMLGGSLLLKQGTRQMSGREGAAVARADAREARTGIGRIGEKTDDLLAARQAMLDQNAKLAQDRANVNLTGDAGIKTAKADAPQWQDVAEAESNRILTEEAKRLARSEKERRAYQRLAEERKHELAGNEKKNIDRDVYLRNRENQYFDAAETPIDTEAAGKIDLIVSEDQVPLREGFVRVKDANGQTYIVKESDAAAAGQPLRTGNELTPEELKVAEKFRQANEKGAIDIVQLPDGRIVARKNIDNNGNYTVGGGFENGGYSVPEVDMGGRPAELKFQYDAGLMPEQPKKMAEFGGKEADRGYGLGDVKDRDQTVKALIEKDPYLARKMNGGGNRWVETARDAGVSFGINSAFHNDLIKSKWGNIDDKRAEAWWNSQMKKLSEFTSAKYDPKERKRNFEAVMDAMSYGLDNIPDEKFLRNPDIYHAIAAKLGRPDWRHPLEMQRPVVPTNSNSTAGPTSSSSGF